MRKLLAILFILLLYLSFSSPVFALSETVGDLEVSYDQPLFSSSEVWFPGKNLTRIVKVVNNGLRKRIVGAKGQDVSNFGNLDRVMRLVIKQVGHERSLWSGTLEEFYQAKEVDLVDLASGGTVEFDLTVSMEETAGNQYQQSSTAFELIIGFTEINDVFSSGEVKGSSETAVVKEGNSNKSLRWLLLSLLSTVGLFSWLHSRGWLKRALLLFRLI